MSKVDVKIKLLDGAKLPEYKTEGAACMDAYAYDSAVIFPGKTAMVSLGFCVEIPEGYEIQVRPRSGLAAKNNITILNTPGCLDSDFRGEVRALVHNTSNEVYKVEVGDRICQLKLSEVPIANLIVVNELSATKRASGGFGSTGV